MYRFADLIANNIADYYTFGRCCFLVFKTVTLCFFDERQAKIMNWYAIRVTYGREMKFQVLLNEAGFETFIPMTVKKIDRNGRKEIINAPAVSNLCFVRGEQQDLYEYFRSFGEACPARFIWDRATREPIIVPTKAMEDFITVSCAMLDDAIYLTEISSKLREGNLVRVLEGPFAGVEGRVVRIRRSRRILVELPGMLAVAATFIPSDNLEIIG